MSWVDAMRLRRRADHVRVLGWANAVAAGVLAVLLHEAWVLAVLWAASVLGVCYAVAHAVDKRAERVVRR